MERRTLTGSRERTLIPDVKKQRSKGGGVAALVWPLEGNFKGKPSLCLHYPVINVMMMMTNDDDDKRYRECTISDHEDDNGDSNNDRC